MPGSSHSTAGVLAILACAVMPVMGQPEGDRVFGRVGPERPVVEIPAEQIGGVQPGAEAPAPGWEVRSDAHVSVPPALVPPVAVSDAQSEADAKRLAEELAATALRLEQPAPGNDRGVTVAAATDSRPLGSASGVSPQTGPVESEPLGGAARSDTGTFNWIARTGVALALVLGLILVMAWVYDRATKARRGIAIGGGGRSPSGLLEVLGRYPIGPRQTLLLLKFDRRVLLLTQSAPRGGPVVTSTLCELNDPEDVASVLVKVRDASGESINQAFREAMDQADRRTGAAIGDAGAPAPIAPPRASMFEARPFEADYDPEDLRRTVGGSETERAQLWEDLGSDRGVRDPIGSLRRRLESMRGGAAG